MQRITRIAFDSNNPDTILLLEQYHSLLLLLKPYLTERTFSILATPKLIDNQQYVGWYTDLEGQPLLLDNIINQLQKGEITKKLQTRLNDIETAVNLMSLSNEEQNLVSIWLPKIKSSSNLIYVINDEPVIVNTFQEGVQPAPAPIFAPIPFWHWWHFLLLALFLVGLLGLLWYLFVRLQNLKLCLLSQYRSQLFRHLLKKNSQNLCQSQQQNYNSPSHRWCLSLLQNLNQR